jgi:hypothetical protein
VRVHRGDHVGGGERGRVPLYICPECADLGCGCVSARIIEDDDSFAWLELAFENNYEPGPTEVFDVRPFDFEKRAYEAAVRRFWPRTVP